jgi:hypothetical protein
MYKKTVVTSRSSLLLTMNYTHTKHCNYLQSFLQNVQTNNTNQSNKNAQLVSYEGLGRFHCTSHLGLMK